MRHQSLRPPARGDFLSIEELRLVRNAADGLRWEPSKNSLGESESRILRASVIRCLLTGTRWNSETDPWPVHARGLIIQSAEVAEDLDLVGADVLFSFYFLESTLAGTLRLADAKTRGICLDQSQLRAIDARQARINGSLQMRDGTVSGNVNLHNASISGALTFEDTALGADALGVALDCESLHVRSGVQLNHSFVANGEVNFRNAKISGDFNCDQGEIYTNDDVALNCDAMNVEGTVSLGKGFRALGAVSMWCSRIGGVLIIENAELKLAQTDKPSTRVDPAVVLLLESAHVQQDVLLRNNFTAHGKVSFWGIKIGGDLRISNSTIESPSDVALDLQSAKIESELNFSGTNRFVGDIDLSQASTYIFSDDHDLAATAVTGRIVLDGFTYVRLHACPTTADARIAWLRRQHSEHLDKNFRPQPWAQIISVLRQMGHEDDARRIAIAREDTIAARGSVGTFERAWYRFLKVTIGYGYRPWRALWLSLALIAVGWATFAAADTLDRMVPRDGAVTALMAKYPTMQVPANYTEFNAAVYSLDVYLPIVELGQDTAWEPTVGGRSRAPQWRPTTPIIRAHAEFVALLFDLGLHRAMYWLEVISGWIFISLFIAGMSGIMKRD